MLSELTASAERVALVGLAKNTGKTEALAALLRELEAAGTRVGVTSVGRDGEARDVIDSRIEKPRVYLAPQSLLATTDSLIRASGVPFELLERTDTRTPLGRVLVVRLKGAGAVEVAGPSGAEQVRAVSDAMLTHGAEKVLIDGAIDRRAACRPDVADGLVLSTGAVLSDQIKEVVQITRRAVELVRLPALARDSPPARHLGGSHARPAGDVLLGDEQEAYTELDARFILEADGRRIRELLEANPWGRWMIVGGALPETFLVDLAASTRALGRTLAVVVGDPTRAFLARHDLSWYERQGVVLETVQPIALLALTINPVAPQSHRLDSAELQRLLGQAIPGVPILDVLGPEYRASASAAATTEQPAG